MSNGLSLHAIPVRHVSSTACIFPLLFWMYHPCSGRPISTRCSCLLLTSSTISFKPVVPYPLGLNGIPSGRRMKRPYGILTLKHSFADGEALLKLSLMTDQPLLLLQATWWRSMVFITLRFCPITPRRMA